MRLPFVYAGRIGEKTGEFNRTWIWYDWLIRSRKIGPFFVSLFWPIFGEPFDHPWDDRA